MDNYNFKLRSIKPSEQLFTTKNGDFIKILDANKDSITDLENFCHNNPHWLHEQLQEHGAIVLRGFSFNKAQQFEKFIANLPGFEPIAEAFMSEEGRVHVDNLKYVLYTNKAYKTGGTLYLGGFHSENYYSTDVPRYICFFCEQPSTLGGETGLINTQKVYDDLNQPLKNALTAKPFFAKRWLLSEIQTRYHLSIDKVMQLLKTKKLKVTNVKQNAFVDLLKPSVFNNIKTNKMSLQINFFQLPKLNRMLRLKFIKNYQGKSWFWHRLVWRLPDQILKVFEYAYIIPMSIKHSKKEAINIFTNKIKKIWYEKTYNIKEPETVNSCFSTHDLTQLAELMHQNYSSCLWQKGDVMLVDNTQVAHAGMPGAGERLIRALIANKLDIQSDKIKPGTTKILVAMSGLEPPTSAL